MATYLLLCLPVLLCMMVALPPSCCQTPECSTKLMTCLSISTAVLNGSEEWIKSGNRTALDWACNTTTYNNITLMGCIADARNSCDSTNMASLTTTTDMYCTPNGSQVCLLETTRCQAPVGRLLSPDGVFDPWQACPAYQDAIRCLTGLTVCKYYTDQYNILQSLQQMEPICAKFAGVPRDPPPNGTGCLQKLYQCSDVAVKALSGSDTWITTGNRAALQQACRNESLQACISDTNNTCRDATITNLTNAIDVVCAPSGSSACQLEAFLCEKSYLSGARKPGESFTSKDFCQKYQAMGNCLSSQTQCKNYYAQFQITQAFDSVKAKCGPSSTGSPQITWSGALLLLTALCGHLITAMHRARSASCHC